MRRDRHSGTGTVGSDAARLRETRSADVPAHDRTGTGMLDEEDGVLSAPRIADAPHWPSHLTVLERGQRMSDDLQTPTVAARAGPGPPRREDAPGAAQKGPAA
ncbi:hypothetical protein ADK41_30835 [Streptomyces caelestis]|uniref:Uncharacterized protein n=1 Tax=Streptomyces caelestis TaxID=36816 RepID=A0A0N0S5G7_9ACTN|nr:hypothetical protein ADK41_30835 [Streptomyces caelestis]KOV21661.1 hypothetical protein ADK58_30710 [Streptomyces sp. XY152]